MEEEKKKRKPKKMRKLEKKIEKLTEKNTKETKSRISKKIMKLEKKKTRLEKWLKIKLPFRFLIKTAVVWLILGGVCYGCSYVPVVKEIKMVAMAGISYVAPEPVVKALDIVTLNIGVNNNDFEWLKTRIKGYMTGEIELKPVIDNSTEHSGGISLVNGKTTYYLDGKEVSEEEFKKYEEDREQRWKERERIGQEQQKQEDELMQEVFGTTDMNSVSLMSIPQILMKVATNSTPEIVSKVIDMIDLTEESKRVLEQDVNRALKIIPKLNNNQMNELVEIITDEMNRIQEENNELMNKARNAVEETRKQMDEEQRKLEEMEQQMQQYKNQ